MDEGSRLTRQQISETVTGWGWRHILGALVTYVRTGSVGEAADLTARLTGFLGDVSEHRFRLDLRADRVIMTIEAAGATRVSRRDIELAQRISSFVGTLGLATEPGLGGERLRPVQAVEIGIDAMDIGAIRPFWKSIMGYADEFELSDPDDALVDPLYQGPAIWFQQMDEPRSQRNRIHFDVVVPHDEARRRIDAAIAAGGTLTYDAEAPAFWVLADPEGNEACVCTWQGRDG
ncbi:MAG TPA: VOC family protein [Streptosporangiaceae bacterium]|jgi:4a-hydroxytetrahydrobiopterin dehydratase|nr:VOC family protein [Streptosporangiaceae bacterium]